MVEYPPSGPDCALELAGCESTEMTVRMRRLGGSLYGRCAIAKASRVRESGRLGQEGTG